MEIPQDFTDRFVDAFGPGEAASFKQAMAQPVPVSIRINPAKTTGRPALDPVPWNPNGFYLTDRPSFTADPWFHAGAYYAQEASSMVVGHLMKQWVDGEMGGQPLRVLDLCGAPGGKSTDIMAMLRPQDLLVSNEVIQSRAGILREVATKWGYPNHLVTNNDPADFQRLPGFFDLMVVDAPCSGEGMFRKDEQAIREWSPAHVELCAARQQRILADVWDALREGGILLYSTCTFNRRENEEILARLRAKHEVTPVTIRGMEAFGFVQSEVGGIPLYRAFPHRIRGEGFSFFVLRKTETGASTYIRSTLRPVSDRFEGMALDGACYAEGDNWVFRTHAAETETLKKYLKMIRSGVEIGTWKKDKLIPSGEWALSHHARLPYPTLSLDRDQALAYMRKEAFELPSPEKGFYLVTYRHLPLGFINHLGNRFNNLFPTNWRIRSRQSFDQMPVVSDLF